MGQNGQIVTIIFTLFILIKLYEYLSERSERTLYSCQLRFPIYSTYYTRTRQSGIWPDISRAIFSRAEGECKYTSEMSGHITR